MFESLPWAVFEPTSPITSRVWSPPHHHTTRTTMLATQPSKRWFTWLGRRPSGKLFFFQGDKVGEPITPLETQLRIKLMMHDRSQLCRWQGKKVNNEANIAANLNIDDRTECMAKRQAFITLKDHKDNFQNKPTCRLINPAKSEIGRISK